MNHKRLQSFIKHLTPFLYQKNLLKSLKYLKLNKILNLLKIMQQMENVKTSSLKIILIMKVMEKSNVQLALQCIQ